MEDLSKRYYRIGDVASILNIPTSTLRFWEKEFTIIKPVRNQKNTRLYTPKDIETIKMIHFLVKEKGLKLDAAQALIRRNRDGVSKQFEVIERLKGIKAKLLTLNHYLGKVKEWYGIVVESKITAAGAHEGACRYSFLKNISKLFFLLHIPGD